MRPQETRPGFRRDIEGLRGIAVLLVVLYHAQVPGFTGGYVGVDVFFVLSGYLITRLLVHELQDRGTIDLVRFYTRRVRRLLPASALVLVVTMLASALLYSPTTQQDIARTGLFAAIYVSNFHFAGEAMNYLAADIETNPLLHMWSLSVEEQFYVVWPFLLLLAAGPLARRLRLRTVPAVLGVILVVFAASLSTAIYLTGVVQPQAFFMPHARAWQFAAGALAFLIAERLLPRALPQFVMHAVTALGWAGLGGVLYAGLSYTSFTPFPGVAALAPTLGTGLLLGANHLAPSTGLRAFLEVRGLREIGRVSYSWYLWHWPAIVLASVVVPDIGIAGRVTAATFAWGLAELTFRTVEAPVRRHPGLARSAARTGVLLACLTVMGAGGALAWSTTANRTARSDTQLALDAARDDIPRIYDDGCHLSWPATDVQAACWYGLDDAEQTIVLFGDSHAAQWFPAVETLAIEQGARLLSLTKSSCPPPVVVQTLQPETQNRRYWECEEWRAAVLDHLDDLQPDAVVMSGNTHYSDISPEEWLAGTRETVDRLSVAARQVIFVRDTPRPGFDARECLAANVWRASWLRFRACTYDAEGSFTELRTIVSERLHAQANVRFVDVAGAVCPHEPCHAQLGEQVVFRDEHHLTASFARELRGSLDPLVNAGH